MVHTYWVGLGIDQVAGALPFPVVGGAPGWGSASLALWGDDFP
jgi:hypothetical protein